MDQGDRVALPDDAHQRPRDDRVAPHRHQPLLRQSRAAAQSERQFDRHELVSLRAPSLSARRVRGRRLPAADRDAQELRRYPHGDGCARHPHPRHPVRRVHHPFRRCGLHPGPASPALACTPHRDLFQPTTPQRPTPPSATPRSARPTSSRSCSTGSSPATRRCPPGTCSRTIAPPWQPLPNAATIEGLRKEILNEVVTAVRSADQPVPLEALADRAVRTLGYDKTVGSAWGGIGSFRDLLAKGLPEDIRLNNQPPYSVYDASRAVPQSEARRIEQRRPEPMRIEPSGGPAYTKCSLPPLSGAHPQSAPRTVVAPSGPPAQAQRGAQAPAQSEALSGQPGLPRAGLTHRPSSSREPARRRSNSRLPASTKEARAPTLSPPDYRALAPRHGAGDQRQRSRGPADAGQHREARTGHRHRDPPRRRALCAGRCERAGPLVRAGRVGEPVRQPLPQLRRRPLPQPEP